MWKLDKDIFKIWFTYLWKHPVEALEAIVGLTQDPEKRKFISAFHENQYCTSEDLSITEHVCKYGIKTSTEHSAFILPIPVYTSREVMTEIALRAANLTSIFKENRHKKIFLNIKVSIKIWWTKIVRGITDFQEKKSFFSLPWQGLPLAWYAKLYLFH